MEKRYIIFTENIHGNLSNTIKGLDREEKWSDLWYIFKPYGYNLTLAEMSNEIRDNREVNEHNISAMQNFANWFED